MKGYLALMGLTAFFGLGFGFTGWSTPATWFGCAFFVFFMGGFAMAEVEA